MGSWVDECDGLDVVDDFLVRLSEHAGRIVVDIFSHCLVTSSSFEVQDPPAWYGW